MTLINREQDWYNFIFEICERIYDIRSLTDEAEAAKELQILFRKLNYCVARVFVQDFFGVYSLEVLLERYQSSGDFVPVRDIKSCVFFLQNLSEYQSESYFAFPVSPFTNLKDSDIFF